MKKIFFSFILIFCLIVPCVTMFSGCEQLAGIVYIEVETLEQLKEALVNDIENDVIVLNANLDLKYSNDNSALKIDSGKNILDLNGHTLTGVDNGENSCHAIDLRGAETELRIVDSSTSQGGAIVGRCYGIQVSRGAKLTIDAGHFICVENVTFNQNVVVCGGTLIINGGSFMSKVYENIYSSSYTWDGIQYQNYVEINNGVFNNIGIEEVEYGLIALEGENQTVVINGGTFNKNNLGYFVVCNSDINLINNAQIPEDQIGVW